MAENTNAALRLYNGGLSVTSTSTPALNGVYALDGMLGTGAQAQANALVMSADAAFADGTASLNWPDRSGTGHTFDPAQFKSLIAAMNNFSSLCAQYAMGILASPPANTATIP